jgi:hypothetical protein
VADFVLRQFFPLGVSRARLSAVGSQVAAGRRRPATIQSLAGTISASALFIFMRFK